MSSGRVANHQHFMAGEIAFLTNGCPDRGAMAAM